MNALRWTASLLLLVFALGTLAPAGASAEERPIQISLLNPVQIFDESDDITGVRLNLLYGRNANVKGIDFGFIAGHTTGNGTGLQWNLVNLTDGAFLGWQWGAVNLVGGDFTGLQVGLFNRHRGTGEGLMWGWVNVAENMSGVMVGLVNVTQQMNGLQIGLVNVIQQKDTLPILPIVNWNF